MKEISIIGVDLAKNVFQLHGAAADSSIVFRKKLSRNQFGRFKADYIMRALSYALGCLIGIGSLSLPVAAQQVSIADAIVAETTDFQIFCFSNQRCPASDVAAIWMREPTARRRCVCNSTVLSTSGVAQGWRSHAARSACSMRGA